VDACGARVEIVLRIVMPGCDWLRDLGFGVLVLIFQLSTIYMWHTTKVVTL
jgi:hypothetical protein